MKLYYYCFNESYKETGMCIYSTQPFTSASFNDQYLEEFIDMCDVIVDLLKTSGTLCELSAIVAADIAIHQNCLLKLNSRGAKRIMEKKLNDSKTKKAANKYLQYNAYE